MKKICFLLVTLVISLYTVNAQYVPLPDDDFGYYLINNGHGECVIGNSFFGFELDTTCSDIVNMTSLMPYQDPNIASLEGVQYFKNLKILKCNGNVITYIPPLVNLIHLKYFDCSFNRLDSLPALPDSIQELYVGSNRLTEIPTLKEGLIKFSCDHNELTSIPNIPSTVKSFVCSWNNISSLPAIPAGMRVLQYAANLITTYVSVPDSLDNLVFERNDITHIPPLPTMLTTLSCGMGQYPLDSLPTLPQGLLTLSCIDAGLTQLPTLPLSLRNLYCDSNILTSLPVLPGTINILHCQNNLLTSLPELPDTMYQLYCQNNPYLTCLPVLGTINRIQFYNTAVSCLINYGNIFASTPLIYSYPLCDATGVASCSVPWNLAGNVWLDASGNCTFEYNDVPFGNAKINLSRNGQVVEQMITGGGGFYSFDVDTLTNYSIWMDTSQIPFTPRCIPNATWQYNLTNSDSIAGNLDFVLGCKSNFDLAAQSIVANEIRPGSLVQARFLAGDVALFYGSRCMLNKPGTITLVVHGPARYVASTGGTSYANYMNGDTVRWNVTFGANNVNGIYNILLQVDTSAQMGDQVCFDIIVAATQAEVDTSNNILSHCFEVVNSFDPNDKQVSPVGNIDTSQYWLTYTVRFQNTGNASAQHIYIMDTLDENVDATTLQLLSYSHEPNVQIKDHYIRFNFTYIYLPDSNSNEPGSHGYIQYKVKRKGDLPIGTTISNTAHIYFDFNEPVVTNTVVNTIAILPKDTLVLQIDRLHKLTFELYPNPANDIVNVILDFEKEYNMKLYDVQGTLLMAKNGNSRYNAINVANFSTGIYYIEVQDAYNNVMRKRILKL